MFNSVDKSPGLLLLYIGITNIKYKVLMADNNGPSNGTNYELFIIGTTIITGRHRSRTILKITLDDRRIS